MSLANTFKHPQPPSRSMPLAAALLARARPGSFLARVLSPKESRQHAPHVPASWYEQHPIGAFGGPSGDIPFASGIGFTSSPFSSYYEKSWGVLPQADQARYRIIYRTVPICHAAVDKLVEVALAKGFGLDVSEDNPQHDFILDAVKTWLLAHPEHMLVLQAAGKDLLVHGTAYVEPCYPETGFDMAQLTEAGEVLFNGKRPSEQEPEEAERAAALLPDVRELQEAGVFSGFLRYHAAFIHGLKAQDRVPAGLYNSPLTMEQNPDKNVVLLSRGDRPGEAGAREASPLVWLKPLDFLTMRVRRDAWGNVFGAVQFLVVPPVAFDTSKIIIGTWNPTSTFYESAYGVSLYQALIRTQEAIWQIENDLLIIGHALAKPPYLFKRGIIDPATGRILSMPDDQAWSAFQTAMSGRQAGSDVFVLANVGTEAINQNLGRSLEAILKELEYHHTQRVIALKVPPQLLGVPEGSSRTTAQVNQGDFILTAQSLQAALGRMLQQVFESILEPYRAALGDDFQVPEVKWNPIMERDESVELDKILRARQDGLLTLKEARHLTVEHGIFEIPDEGEAGYDEAMADLQGEREAKAEQDAFRFNGPRGKSMGRDVQEQAEASAGAGRKLRRGSAAAAEPRKLRG